MNLGSMAQRALGKLPAPVAAKVYRGAQQIPGLRRVIEAEYEAMLADAPGSATKTSVPAFAQLPVTGRPYADILDDVAELAASEAAEWRDGRASGAVYHGDTDHIEFLDRVYALQSQSNPLHADLWPSAMKFESEVVAMTASMLGSDRSSDEIVGTITSGGTESIIMAVKAHRDRAGITRPDMVIPESAHVAFEKAGQLLGIRCVRIPVAADGRADVGAMTDAIGRRTILVAGSAPGFPHGIIDPISELSEAARRRGIGFHTDACLGGFVLPWAERLGYDVPTVDFRNPGVTSMSADTHKYGYAPKGTSVVLYRGRDLRHHQYHVATDWPGGLYYSPAIAGSRPGGLVAGAWAAMLSMGETGYLRATRSILETATQLRIGISAIADLEVIGDPLFVIAFRSEALSVYEIMAHMATRGWSLNGLHHPPAVHIAVTLRHTQPGVADAFLLDLAASVEAARATGGGDHTGSAPLYGMAATFPARGAVADLMRRYIDRLYEVTRDPSSRQRD